MGWFGNAVTIILELLLLCNVAITEDNYKAHISTQRNGYEPLGEKQNTELSLLLL